MRTLEIRRVRSGVEADFAWVSLWSRGAGRTLEPLHLVCQRQAQGGRYAKFDSLYLERDEQAVACYGGAERVVVNAGGIEVRLNRAGVKALGLNSSFVLAAPAGLSGWVKARRVLATMASYPTGRAIQHAEPIAGSDGG